MLTCIALMLTVGAAELPSLAAEVEAEARTLSAQTEVTPEFLAKIVVRADAPARADSRAGPRGWRGRWTRPTPAATRWPGS